MKVPLRSRYFRQAFSLVEMTVVILAVLALTRIGFVSSKKMSDWKAGRAASETLRSVNTARRLFLADNPTYDVTQLRMNKDGLAGDIFSYLPNNSGTMPVPTVQSLSGVALSIKVNDVALISPVYPITTSGTRYDPSPSTTDSLWDVGE